MRTNLGFPADRSFPELICGDLLVPGGNISVMTMTVLFTDLRESTLLYTSVYKGG